MLQRLKLKVFSLSGLLVVTLAKQCVLLQRLRHVTFFFCTSSLAELSFQFLHRSVKPCQDARDLDTWPLESSSSIVKYAVPHTLSRYLAKHVVPAGWLISVSSSCTLSLLSVSIFAQLISDRAIAPVSREPAHLTHSTHPVSVSHFQAVSLTVVRPVVVISILNPRLLALQRAVRQNLLGSK